MNFVCLCLILILDSQKLIPVLISISFGWNYWNVWHLSCTVQKGSSSLLERYFQVSFSYGQAIGGMEKSTKITWQHTSHQHLVTLLMKTADHQESKLSKYKKWLHSLTIRKTSVEISFLNRLKVCMCPGVQKDLTLKRDKIQIIIIHLIVQSDLFRLSILLQ